MLTIKISLLFGLAVLLILSTAAPDSAGMVEMVNGLAYGGIPYGSVSGMVARYPGFNPLINRSQARQLSTIRPSIIITPNFRASRLFAVVPRSVQIYNLPGVIAPGVVGTISQIGF